MDVSHEAGVAGQVPLPLLGQDLHGGAVGDQSQRGGGGAGLLSHPERGGGDGAVPDFCGGNGSGQQHGTGQRSQDKLCGVSSELSHPS